MKRYFLVFFTGINKYDGKQVTCYGHCNTINGEYINHKLLLEKLSKINNLSEIAITNIIELTENDMKNWLEE